MGDVKLPGLPDISGLALQDKQLRDFLIAVKITIDILTGQNPKSNKSLIEYLNDNQT